MFSPRASLALRASLTSRHALPVALLFLFALLFWGRVLFTGQALLPGAMLAGFAPFGSDPQAPWNILQWDGLAQYYPWRAFAARQLQSGLLPLWNPHQFSGAPFMANGQSAVFYPLNFPFWISDVAWAFGFSAFCHTLLAALSTYALLQCWNLSRAASVLGALAFGFSGYLLAWVMLPTLANTASWLPLCVLLLDRAATPHKSKNSSLATCHLSLALCCALLAGHAQVFFYILVALGLRALFLPRALRAGSTLGAAGIGCLLIGAMQILPTLELARLGHRAGSKPTLEGWNFLVPRALQIGDLPSLVVPRWPQLSFSENFGYIGLGVLALSLLAFSIQNSQFRIQNRFAFALAAFGLLYATATPLARVFYFGVPGLSQMGGVGRALVLWSFGAALLAALGLDALRKRWSTPIIPAVALLVVSGELFFNGFAAHSTAARESIYPATELTRFLQARTRDGARVLLLTPRASWLPSELLQNSGRNHPPGVLPPNGAMVYGLFDVNGYDSLAPRTYREFLAPREQLRPGQDLAPALNGNMILLNNPHSSALDALRVRTIVSQDELNSSNLTEVLRANNCIVYQRRLKDAPRVEGRDFSPGWREGKYQPQSFRLGAFLSLLALGAVGFVFAATRVNFSARKFS